MTENPKPKLRALIPTGTQDEAILRQTLTDLGFSIREYIELGSREEIEHLLSECQPEEKVLLFINDRPNTETSSPNLDPNPVQPATKNDPSIVVDFAEMVNESLKDLLADQRVVLQTVFMLPRNSELLKRLPETVNYLSKPLAENDTHYLIRKWVAQFDKPEARDPTSDPDSGSIPTAESRPPSQTETIHLFRKAFPADPKGTEDSVIVDAEFFEQPPLKGEVSGSDAHRVSQSNFASKTTQSPSETNPAPSKILPFTHDDIKDFSSEENARFGELVKDLGTNLNNPSTLHIFLPDPNDSPQFAAAKEKLRLIKLDIQQTTSGTEIVPSDSALPIQSDPNALPQTIRDLLLRFGIQVGDTLDPASSEAIERYFNALRLLEVDAVSMRSEYVEIQTQIKHAAEARLEAEERARKLEIGKAENASIAREKCRDKARLADMRLRSEVEDYRSLTGFFAEQRPSVRYRPKSLQLFHNNPPEFRLVVEPDYQIDRDLSTLSRTLGFRDIVQLKNLVQGFSDNHFKTKDAANYLRQKKIKFTPIVLHLGPGNCSVLDAFAQAEGAMPAEQVAYGFSVLVSFPDLLLSILQPSEDFCAKRNITQVELQNIVTHFLPHLNALLAKYHGRSGRYQVNLKKPEDHRRLRKHLMALSQNDEVTEIIDGKRKFILGTTGLYSEDKRVGINEDDRRLFEAFQNNPETILETLFPGFMSDMTPEQMEQFFHLKGRNMICDDFRRIPERLSGSGQFVTFAQDCRASSHLDDEDFMKTTYATACHLAPGGAYITDGFRESYTWYRRIDELRIMRDKLGDSFEIYLIGDETAPKSAAIVRKIPGSNGQTLRYPIDDFRPLLDEHCQMVRLDKYEKTWPEDAFKNKLYWLTKYKTMRLVNEGIADGRYRPETTQIWQKKCYDHIYRRLQQAIDSYLTPKNKFWSDLRERIKSKKIRANGNPRFFHQVLRINRKRTEQVGEGSHYSNDFSDFFNTAVSKHGLEMDFVIRKTLDNHFMEDSES